MTEESTLAPKTHFIRNIIDEDLKVGKHQTIVTRFPPEPNGYLHIGHAKAICINFGLAQDFQGQCHLRFDDTNPIAEEQEYIDAIQADIQWLGMDWGEKLFYTSDYYERLYQAAVTLIQAGKAYIDDLDAEQMRLYRGTLTEPGKNSPNRERPIEENLALFEQMKQGQFEEGQYTLRAKIDMTSGNINLRDPIIYRILKQSHHRTSEDWCIYPMYDFAHALSDAIEGITHSLCSLEFQDHRPLYDWVVEHCQMPHQPRQIEFSRLNLSYTITSKRKLRKLVEADVVTGWNDPRMPTLSGLRRRGFTPQAIRQFCHDLGVSKQDSVIDFGLLEAAVRNDLNVRAPRKMAILDPIKVVITNYPEGQIETLSSANHPQNPEMGRRELEFGSEIYIDRSDYFDNPPPKFFRLSPGKEVRLLNAYVIRADEVIRDESGQAVEIKATYLPETLGGKKPADGRKIKGTIHWVAAHNALEATVRVYDRLFSEENPGGLDDFMTALNPNSLKIFAEAKVEPSLKDAVAEDFFQFQRMGYFCADRYDHQADALVFNQIVSLRETWQK